MRGGPSITSSQEGEGLFWLGWVIIREGLAVDIRVKESKE